MFFWLSKEMDGFDFCWGKNWMDVVKFGASRGLMKWHGKKISRRFQMKPSGTEILWTIW
jgi:hypothetical protein